MLDCRVLCGFQYAGADLGRSFSEVFGGVTGQKLFKPNLGLGEFIMFIFILTVLNSLGHVF